MDSRRKVKFYVVLIAAFLGCVFLALSILSSGGNYSAQKELFKLNKKLEILARDPEHTPAASYDELILEYRDFLEDYGSTDSGPTANMIISRLHVLKKDYDSAIRELDNTLNRYPDNEGVALALLDQKIRIYMQMPDYRSVLLVLSDIQANFPKSARGLSAPLTKADILKRAGMDDQAYQALGSAAIYYKKLKEENEDSPVGVAASNMLAQTYLLQKNWDLALEALGNVLLEYGDSDLLQSSVAENIVRTMNTVAVTKLGSIDRPVAVYRSFIEKFPAHPYNSAMSSMIKSLNKVFDGDGE